MSIDIETARQRLRRNINALDDCADDLADLRDNIPPSPQELSKTRSGPGPSATKTSDPA